MADRMSRMWAPIDSGVLNIGAGTSGFLLVNSVLEASLDREIRQFTVTRVVAKIWVASHTADENVYLMHGMRIDNENVQVGSITPSADETADWILHGSVWARTPQLAQFLERDVSHIDNRSQRKSQGEQSELRWYYENVGGSNTLYFGIQGRALLLIP